MIQIKTLLAPVDFSERTRDSLDYAFNLAHHFDSKVILFHVVPVARYPVIMDGIYAPKKSNGLSKDIEEQVNQELDALVKQVAPRKSVEKIVESGNDPARCIREQSEKESVDLIVMPTRGFGPIRRFLLGSVTSKVLDDVECPVFTGAHLDPIPPFEPASFRRIGCAIDLGDDSERVLTWAKEFAQSLDGKLTVMHTVASLQAVAAAAPVLPESKLVTSYDARGQLEKLLSKTGTEATLRVERGPVESMVKDIGEKEQLNVLIAGRRNDGLSGRLHPHVYGIIRESPCPVISV